MLIKFAQGDHGYTYFRIPQVLIPLIRMSDFRSWLRCLPALICCGLVTPARAQVWPQPVGSLSPRADANPHRPAQHNTGPPPNLLISLTPASNLGAGSTTHAAPRRRRPLPPRQRPAQARQYRPKPHPHLRQLFRDPPPSASDATLESELRTLLVGKPLFLRGCYLFNDLRFNERGGLYDSSPRGSFTLSGIQIESLRLTRKELILEGDRYGYRFLGALPGNNPTDDMERIKITPKKKILRIRIEREEVAASRKEKEKPAKSQPGLPDAASPRMLLPEHQTASASVTTAAAPAPASPATPDTAAPAQSAPNPADSSSAKNDH